MITNRITLLSLIACCFLLPNLISAQQLDHVQGEILLKFWPEDKVEIGDWINSKQKIDGRRTELKYFKEVSNVMDIHSIRFDFNSVSETEMLNSIRRDSKVQAAQFNHFVKLRSTIPDDASFDSQWQYINTGQSGGTIGADIDMDLAWDVATGGITADGDTIVVCVIDDGVNLSHPDMVANLWKNHGEIEDNGIDDDGNGFVDDYHGWDTGSDSDAVGDGGGHGTPVAGIVGAVGNNGIGVAGVNWDVKLMIVQGGTGIESEVLEAYSYPLVARKAYNETNGAEGAFVVSTNASWGIDQGQPANAPLWCSFYDSLGVHGILNCGATANANFNIDVVGDLPTACPSEYMIAVTNMNDNDVKVTGAGYGATAIDLGAFGQGTYTTTINNYGGFGGTSGATPHVTGSIALLYSAPCPTLISIAKNNPSSAAEMVRDFILEGVDPNTSLDGITVTGGRLNVATAINELMANCGPCPPPSSIEITDIIDVSSTISWWNNDSIQTNEIQWRMAGTTDWNVVPNVASPHNLIGLNACTNYEMQIVGYCSSDTTYSEIVEFKTDGCCVNPETISVSGINDQSATLTWNAIFAATSYDYRYAELGSGSWTTENTTDLSVTLNSLMPCTDYEVQVKTNCGGGLEVDFSESKTFRTKGCGACTDLTYCQPIMTSIEDEWIESITIGDLVNISGGNNSYGDFTEGPTATFTTYQTYDINLTPGFSGSAFNEGWGIWIDLNHDGEFDDETEQVYANADQTSDPIVASITIPGGLEGVTRLRVAMAYSSDPDACNINAGFGEVEDYCITMEIGIQPCDIPSNLSALNISSSSADLNWDEGLGAASYLVELNVQGDNNIDEIPASTNILPVDNLMPETTYEYRVKSLCPNSLESVYSEKISFTTAVLSSTHAINGLQSWSVFPSPFEHQLQLTLETEGRIDELHIEITDQVGRILQQVELKENIDQNNVLINTADLGSGIYLLSIRNKKGDIQTKKIVKY